MKHGGYLRHCTYCAAVMGRTGSPCAAYEPYTQKFSNSSSSAASRGGVAAGCMHRNSEETFGEGKADACAKPLDAVLQG